MTTAQKRARTAIRRALEKSKRKQVNPERLAAIDAATWQEHRDRR